MDSRFHGYLRTLARSIPCTVFRCQTISSFIALEVRRRPPRFVFRDCAEHAEDGASIRPHFHYVPLHSSPAGKRYGRTQGELAVTTGVARRLARLPLWADLSDDQVQRVIDVVHVAVG